MSVQSDSPLGLHLPQPSTGPTMPEPMYVQPAAIPTAPLPQAPLQQPTSAYPVASTQTSGFEAVQPVSVQPQQAPSAVQAIPVSSPDTHMPLPASVQPAVASSPQPQVSDNEKNGDTLDEEWVSKAQSLMAQYKDDPYSLSKALAALRSDYLKVRHGIISKVSDK